MDAVINIAFHMPNSNCIAFARYFRPVVALAALVCAVTAVAKDDKESESESGSSGKTPLGLKSVAPIQYGGSDEASKKFQTESLPELNGLLKGTLSEGKSLKNLGAFVIDPARLNLKFDATVRTYFVGEGAGYENSIGFNTIKAGESMPTGGLDDSAQLIFANASSAVSSYDPKSTVKRTSSNPLLPGDFVDLGKFDAGTTLDFFLIADGANGGTKVYTADPARNPDNMQHVIYAVPDSPYLVLGFEDLYGGGDNDFNDVLFAVDIGYENLRALLATPEPSTWAAAALLGVGGVFWMRSRRQTLAVARS